MEFCPSFQRPAILAGPHFALPPVITATQQDPPSVAAVAVSRRRGRRRISRPHLTWLGAVRTLGVVAGVVAVGVATTATADALRQPAPSLPATLAGQTLVLSPEARGYEAGLVGRVQAANPGARAVAGVYGDLDTPVIALVADQGVDDVAGEVVRVSAGSPATQGRSTCAVIRGEDALCIRSARHRTVMVIVAASTDTTRAAAVLAQIWPD